MKGLATTLIAAVVAIALLTPCYAEDADELRKRIIGNNVIIMDPADIAKMIAKQEALLEGQEEGRAEGEGEEKEKHVKVLLDSDVIILNDGTEVKGTVIFVAGKAAIILTKEGEQMIPREDIKEIVRGKDHDTPVKLPIRKKDGFQFIVMEPVEEEEDAEGAEAAPERPAKRTPAKDRPAPPSKRRPAKGRGELEKLLPEEIKELLNKDGELDALLKRLKEKGGDKEKNPVKW